MRRSTREKKQPQKLDSSTQTEVAEPELKKKTDFNNKSNFYEKFRHVMYEKLYNDIFEPFISKNEVKDTWQGKLLKLLLILIYENSINNKSRNFNNNQGQPHWFMLQNIIKKLDEVGKIEDIYLDRGYCLRFLIFFDGYHDFHNEKRTKAATNCKEPSQDSTGSSSRSTKRRRIANSSSRSTKRRRIANSSSSSSTGGGGIIQTGGNTQIFDTEIKQLIDVRKRLLATPNNILEDNKIIIKKIYIKLFIYKLFREFQNRKFYSSQHSLANICKYLNGCCGILKFGIYYDINTGTDSTIMKCSGYVGKIRDKINYNMKISRGTATATSTATIPYHYMVDIQKKAGHYAFYELLCDMLFTPLQPAPAAATAAIPTIPVRFYNTKATTFDKAPGSQIHLDRSGASQQPGTSQQPIIFNDDSKINYNDLIKYEYIDIVEVDKKRKKNEVGINIDKFFNFKPTSDASDERSYKGADLKKNIIAARELNDRDKFYYHILQKTIGDLGQILTLEKIIREGGDLSQQKVNNVFITGDVTCGLMAANIIPHNVILGSSGTKLEPTTIFIDMEDENFLRDFNEYNKAEEISEEIEKEKEEEELTEIELAEILCSLSSSKQNLKRVRDSEGDESISKKQRTEGGGAPIKKTKNNKKKQLKNKRTRKKQKKSKKKLLKTKLRKKTKRKIKRKQNKKTKRKYK